jgi:hypothetical protein
MIYTEGREQFEQILARHSNILRDHTQRYIGGLNSADREALLVIAIDAAWEHRNDLPKFSPTQPTPLPKFWQRCLKYAATSREKWLVSVATLPGVFEKRWTLGDRLGETN